MNAIEVKGLKKFYGRARGIDGLDLTISEGEFFGFVGPNGAGKSTTIRILLGLLKADSGSARILGKDIEKEKVSILSEVGYLPSEAAFYSGMRVKEMLALSANLRKSDCREEAKRLCERLNLDTSRKVEELSLGNRKKTAIVCALQSRPKICILDEPTSGLDPLMQREFFMILKERHEQGMTVFLSSHVLSEIQNNCTRAAIIREGRIIACDDVEALAQTNAKQVHIRGKIDVSSLKEIRDLQQTEDGTGFLYAGDINRLIQVLSKQQIRDLSISEPNLEEIFMHYYQEGGAENDHDKA